MSCRQACAPNVSGGGFVGLSLYNKTDTRKISVKGNTTVLKTVRLHGLVGSSPTSSANIAPLVMLAIVRCG